MDTELTPRGHSIWQQAKEDYLTKLERKALAKAKKHRLTEARIEVTGEADRLGLLGRGWTLESSNDYAGGVYKAWFRKATLVKDSLQLHLDLADRG